MPTGDDQGDAGGLLNMGSWKPGVWRHGWGKILLQGENTEEEATESLGKALHLFLSSFTETQPHSFVYGCFRATMSGSSRCDSGLRT